MKVFRELVVYTYRHAAFLSSATADSCQKSMWLHFLFLMKYSRDMGEAESFLHFSIQIFKPDISHHGKRYGQRISDWWSADSARD